MIGQVFEAAGWFVGEPPEQMKADLRRQINLAAETHGVVFGPVTFRVLAPGDERVPEPPKHLPRGVRLLVAEAAVVAIGSGVAAQSFIADLDPIDLERLRTITRQAHRRHNPNAPQLTDMEVDVIIDEVGRGSAMKALKAAVDSGTVH